ncbi:S9 family peptidase [Pleurocapsa sp. PCC 7319]|uniref:S9 family peptidase n=1 Tax=Pleurocapsa sp. PCC 7319 TaxID=118161 RepID=UPI00034AACE7|nr:oligopeptidase B [Pleurocapsa sp. PCC 7319]
MTQKSNPPIATKHPHELVTHGDKRIDNYYWLRQQDNPEVIDYLKVENDYTEERMQHTEELQKSLYDEILSRIKETDLSVPYRLKDYYYYFRTEEGQAYSIFCRKYQSLDAEEEILLDQNELAEGKEFFSLGVASVSPNQQILAYSTDTTGAEQYTLVFLDLSTRALYSETIPNTYYSFAWGNDNLTVFYTKVDDANRPYQLWRHILGSDPSKDVLVYQEDDEAYYLGVGKTRSRAYILLELGSKITSECHYLDANNPRGEFKLFQPRQTGVEYSIEHHSDRFYIVTNEEAVNFRLRSTPVDSTDKTNWKTVIPHRENVMLEGIDAFADYLVIYERKGGLPTARIQTLATGEITELTFPEPTFSFSGGNNPEFDTTKFRFGYSSMITPSSVFDYDLETGERELKKETEVLGGYDRSLYASERLIATASDGTEVPISLVYKKGINQDSSNPLWLTGYGSYGYPYPATFSSVRLSLLDRGFIFAIAHIRGGQEMGRKWYEEGKFLHKKNTFTDFIACAEHLIAEKWTNSDRLVISGGSAGGLLMGAVINLRPDLFKAVIADVPFVDVLTSILDTSLPLTVLEWEEWGNPNQPEYYDYIKSYSPYDNVTAKDYPALLITAGLNDSRVKYWEPAKWTAKLREMKTDDHLLLLKTNMSAGHGGASGRYEHLQEIAFEYAFVLDQLNLK